MQQSKSFSHAGGIVKAPEANRSCAEILALLNLLLDHLLLFLINYFSRVPNLLYAGINSDSVEELFLNKV